MKKTLIAAAILTCTMLAGCGTQSDISARLDGIEQRLSALEGSETAAPTSTANPASAAPHDESAATSATDGDNTVVVETDDGTYKVTVTDAKMASELNRDGVYPALISLQIENISYDDGDGGIEFHAFNGLKVSDPDNNLLEIYDIIGPDEVHSPSLIPQGFKEKATYAYFLDDPNNIPAALTVHICHDYKPVGTVTINLTQ